MTDLLITGTTTADETLIGGSGNDTLDGGAGNDTLEGGAGIDTYRFGVGYGHDVINEDPSGNSTLFLKMSLALQDITLSQSGSDLIITINSTGETLTVVNQFGNTANGYEAREIRFELSGTSFSLRDPLPSITGTSGNDTLNGTDAGEKIAGLNGRDIINGLGGDDTLVGNEGSDTLTGGAGHDQFFFRFEGAPIGSGQFNFAEDVITDFNTSEDQIDLSDLSFGHITQFGDLAISNSGSDAVIDLGGGHILTLQGIQADELTASQFIFAAAGGATNTAPELASPIADVTSNEDAPFVLDVHSNFSDADSDTLTYTATLDNGDALPSWLSFNGATGVFSGTPLNVNVGQIAVKVTAADGVSGNVSDTFLLTVNNTNDAPLLFHPIFGPNSTGGVPFTLTLPVGMFGDMDSGDMLTLSAMQQNGDPLPAWLTFNAATGTFSGTPANSDAGALALKVIATDLAGATNFDNFTLTVKEGNHAPVLQHPVDDVSTDESTPFSLTLPTGMFTDVDTTLVINEDDEEEYEIIPEPITLSATLENGDALPAWLSFNSATGTFSGTPAHSDAGQIAVTITATDTHNATATDTFLLTVGSTGSSNSAPDDAPIPDVSVDEDTPFTLDVHSSFSDPDNDTLTYAATLENGDPLPAWLGFDAVTGVFGGTPANGDVGQIAVKVTATDGVSGSVSDTFLLTVNNTNDAPVLSNPVADTAINEDDLFIFTLPAGTFTDADAGDTLTLSATLADGSELPAWLTFDASNATLAGYPGSNDVGALTVKFTATDSSGASVSDDFTITINHVNHAPIASTPIALQQGTGGTPFTFTLPSTTFLDTDPGDVLTLSALRADGAPLPAWLTFDPATGTFSGTPANSDAGAALTLRVTATDVAGAQADRVFKILITPGNTAPVLSSPVTNMSTNEDAPFSFAVPAGTFTDADAGDSLTLSATRADGSALPAWLSFNAATSSFSGTPANGDVGAVAVKITATDSAGATASGSFTLTVNNVNDAPVLNVPVADQTATGAAPFSLTLPAGMFTDVDAGDTLTLSAKLDNGSPLPAWLSFNAATRTFSGTPATAGAITVRVTATDTAGTTATDSFILNVQPGSVIYTGTGGSNKASGGAGSDSMSGGAGNDSLTGLAGDDTLDGGADNDSVNGGAGMDSLLGGTGNDTVFGGTDNDTIDGGAGADSLIGNGGSDSLSGGDGNDTIRGGSGSDTISGGAGNDRILAGEGLETGTGTLDTDGMLVSGDAGNDTITGGSGNDTVSGGTEKDSIDGGAGNDILTGDLGDDSIAGSAGNDSIDGGDGNDTLKGGNDADTISGGSGKDNLDGGTGADSLDGGADNDTLSGGADNDTLAGGLGADSIAGGDGDDSITGGAGNDSLSGGADNDTIDGGTENDSITGNRGDDSLDGGDGNDTIFGGQDNDTVNGGAGADYLIGNSGNDLISGGDGNDTIRGGLGNDTLDGGAGNDSIRAGEGDDGATGDTDTGALNVNGNTGFDTLEGGRGADTLHGGADSDTVAGKDGNDVLYGDAGNDSVNGGGGNDSLDGSDGNDTIDGGADKDTLAGGAGADCMDGGADNDSLNGGSENDRLSGGAGNDTLIGGAGADNLDGGAGKDIFVFEALTDSTNSARDLLAGFDHGQDKLNLAALHLHYSDLAISYDKVAKITLVDDLHSDFAVAISGKVTLDAGDFTF